MRLKEPIVVVTIAKNDVSGLARTMDSLFSISSMIRHLIITPFDESETHNYARQLSIQVSNCEIVEDSGSGIYPAMNLALEHCQGEEWIWFLNAGDTLHSPDSFQHVYQKLSRIENLWAYGGVELIDEDFSPLKIRKSPSSFSLVKQLFATQFVSHQSVILKAKLLKALNGFDLRFQVASDWDLLCRASKLGPPANLNLVLSRFQLGGFSTKRRFLGNIELLKLRKIHLGVFWQPLSFVWFVYRYTRILLINTFDLIDPRIIRKWRHTRSRSLLSKFF